MLDTAQIADPTLDLLRERETELAQIVRDHSARLDELRELIARATRCRQRVTRRLRTPAERIAEAHTAPPPAIAEAAALDDALASYGRAVAARDPAVEDA